MTDEFSLLDKVNNGETKPTGAKPKLPFKLDGLDSENLNVYRIPLDMLYYNDANGRIRAARTQFEDVARSVDVWKTVEIEQTMFLGDYSLLAPGLQ